MLTCAGTGTRSPPRPMPFRTDITCQSLRDRIGIVPQSPVLFNDTIMNNIRYARITASDEEVHDACKAAWIHDKILGFSDGTGISSLLCAPNWWTYLFETGYDTRVGERGV